MKNEKNLYHNTEEYMIRVPMFSVDKYFMFLSNYSDKEDIDKLITALCNNAVFREAILAASENLYSKIDEYISGKLQDSKKIDDFRISILKYYIRMSSRTTPFGLFACVGIGGFDKRANEKMVVGKKNKKARPDFEWIMKVVKNLEEKFYKSLQYTTNNIVTNKGDRIYLPYNTGMKEEEISLRNSKPVQILVDLCRQQYKSYKNMMNALREEYSSVRDETLEKTIKELISKEVLISNLRPSLTTEDQLIYIIDQVKRIPEAKNELDVLEMIYEDIQSYNKLVLGKGENILKKILHEMKDMAGAATYLQIDTKVEIENNGIESMKHEELRMFVDFLFVVSQNKKSKKTIYDEYKMDFIEKYGEDREVLLTEMLDNDFGIGAPYSYMHPYAARNRRAPQSEENEKLSVYFWQKLNDAYKKNMPLIIENDFIENILSNAEISEEDLPLSLELNFICKKRGKELFYYLGPNVGSTGAGKTFGRFTHLVTEYKDLCMHISKEEEQIIDENTIICELTYIPQKPRLANVTRNYNNRRYELSFYFRDVNSKKQFISLDDIYVGIENRKFYLKSGQLNKKIRIKTNNMLNVIGDSNIIRFLKEVEQDGIVEWSDFPWTRLFNHLPHIPEIRYKNLILSTEMWRINKEELTSHDKYEEFTNSLDVYAIKNSLPQFVYVSESDNRLLLDLNNEWCKRILFKILKTEKSIKLLATEKGTDLVFDKEGNGYACEIVVPFVRNGSKPKLDNSNIVTQKIVNVDQTVRYKMLGSDWFYVKIYGVGAWQDNVIVYYISQFANQLLQEGVIDKYFFMRYADPEFHIRLRFHGINIVQYSNKITTWLYEMFAEKTISRFEISCYEREIERYGGAYGIDIAEEIFFVDSKVTEQLLLLMKGGKISFEKELIGVISAIFYMDQFGWDFYRQLNWLDSFILKTDYKSDYKKVRKIYEELCNDCNNWHNLVQKEDGKLLYNLFTSRAISVKKYRKAIQQGMITTSEETIIGSIIHLSFNRLFGINREFERKILSLLRHTLYSLKYVKEKGNDN